MQRVASKFSVTLEIERTQGNPLRSNVQGAAKGEFAGAAAEGFFGADAGEIWRVVLFRNVREDEVARAPIEDFGISEKFADD